MKLSQLIIAITLILAPQLRLPDGNDAWLVEVFTSGGFSGSGMGNFAVSSRGQVVCSPPAMNCPADFDASGFQPLVEMIPFGTAGAAIPSPIGLCNDCLTRTIVIRRRDAQGLPQTYTASWNDLNRGAVPTEVVKLYESVIKLAR